MTCRRQKIRDHMGIVLQDPYLFSGTVESNVSLGDPRITREKVQACIRCSRWRSSIETFARMALMSQLWKKGVRFLLDSASSFHSHVRLRSIRRFLILDEATSNIDTETEEIIQHAMDVLKKGRTTFIIAHRLSTIKNADRILVLDRGEIVERGNHEELMEKRGRYYQMYQLQQGQKQGA